MAEAHDGGLQSRHLTGTQLPAVGPQAAPQQPRSVADAATGTHGEAPLGGVAPALPAVTGGE
eukprot:3929895-Alexandrium_andersonii.AAC.1